MITVLTRILFSDPLTPASYTCVVDVDGKQITCAVPAAYGATDTEALAWLNEREADLRTTIRLRDNNVYDRPQLAPDFLIASPTVSSDPKQALSEAVAELGKTEKSLGLVALSLAKGFSADTDSTTLKAAYTQALTDLQAIQNETAWTTAKVIDAVQKEAAILEKVLRFLSRMVS